ncbi:MAG TPA: ArsB/NhaD family transporter [Anaerolineaceae bacterium]|nr:ArsB/NhaD family transporter [Anaerolineaceae bacterium]
MIISTVIFVACLVLIFSERLNRTIASLAGAILMVGAGLVFKFMDEDQAVASLDVNTLGLLLGMMILVSILEPTGFFQYLAVRVTKLSRGRPVRLLILLGGITTVVSMVLDNVTTVVLIAPVTILICEILGVNPLPYLMAEALLSNTGGVATLVGDPPNILIGSAANLTFLDFLTHSLPIVVLAWFAALGILFYLYRRELAQKPTNLDAVADLNPAEALRDPRTARRALIVIAITILFFLLEEFLNLRPALVALAGAAGGLVWTRPPIQETLKRVQWDVLLFFAALFVMIGGMRSAGVFDVFMNLATHLGTMPPLLLGLILLWFVAVLSAVVDNVPITIALIPVIQNLGDAGLNITPLWWALVFGAGFGGNGTIIGSTANMIVTSLSERTRHPITPRLWSRRGLPVMLGTVLVASLCYLVLFELLSRPTP